MQISVAKPKGIASQVRINPAPLTAGETPMIIWFAVGAIIVGGATYYFMRRKSS